jgi:hypothetical protein
MIVSNTAIVSGGIGEPIVSGGIYTIMFVSGIAVTGTAAAIACMTASDLAPATINFGT